MTMAAAELGWVELTVNTTAAMPKAVPHPQEAETACSVDIWGHNDGTSIKQMPKVHAAGTSCEKD